MTTPDPVRVQRLDALAAAAQDVLTGRHYLLHDGAVILDPATGDPLRDPEPGLQALRILLRVEELRVMTPGVPQPRGWRPRPGPPGDRPERRTAHPLSQRMDTPTPPRGAEKT